MSGFQKQGTGSFKNSWLPCAQYQLYSLFFVSVPFHHKWATSIINPSLWSQSLCVSVPHLISHLENNSFLTALKHFPLKLQHCSHAESTFDMMRALVEGFGSKEGKKPYAYWLKNATNQNTKPHKKPKTNKNKTMTKTKSQDQKQKKTQNKTTKTPNQTKPSQTKPHRNKQNPNHQTSSSKNGWFPVPWQLSTQVVLHWFHLFASSNRSIP